MPELLKLLYEQPKKLRLLILNFLKFILTILIINGLHDRYKYNFLKNINGLDGSNHIGNILLYLLLFVAYWLAIWYILETIFVFLIGMRKRKHAEKENQEKNQRAEDKKDIGKLLQFSRAFTIKNKDFIIPNDNIHDIANIAQFVDEDKSFNVPNTLFGEAVYILFVGWLYLIFNYDYLDLTVGKLMIMGSVILVLIFIYRGYNDVLSRLKDHTEDIRIFLDELEYRKIVMDTVIKDFKGRINIDKKSFDLNWGRTGYHIRDLYHHHEGIGNAKYLKKFKGAYRPDLSDIVLILNFNPNEELKTLFREMKVMGLVVAIDDSELLDNLVVELNRLKALHEAIR